ncbi:putative lipid II flippase FtsW [Candidatus Microgenomates bacterium]|nr:putative lipid II flippase FtsW [Candidatus Microgenomates bacterium]
MKRLKFKKISFKIPNLTKKETKRKKRAVLKKQKKERDYLLILIVVFLSLFGLLMIFEASTVSAYQEFGDKYYFVREQSKWLGIGIVALLVFSFLDYHHLYNLAVPLLFSTICFLGAVFIPGIGIKVKGASRWINLRLFSFQPAELAKLTLTVYLSAWFASKEKGRLIAFLFLLGIILGLVVLEPDLGTTVIIAATAIVIYFVSESPISHFFLLIPLGLFSFLGLALISPYRFRRLVTFFDPSTDPQGASYHIRQILLSLGSGGLTGVGIGKSRQKHLFLPEATTDSIFAIVGEEFGFFGAFILILLFLFIIYRGFSIAKRAPDRFGRFLAVGITAGFAIQVIINLSAMVVLLPLTGAPLPLLSYGGSSLLITFVGMGILFNISRQRVN